MDLENMDTMQICEDLATAFDKIVQDNKQILPHFDELIGKGGKFQKDLKSALVSLCAFLDVFQQIADGASTTNSSNIDSGIVMTRIVLRQRAFESHLKHIATTLEESVLIPLQTKPEEWKKNVILLDRQHAKDLKLMRTSIKRHADELSKLRKKAKKDPSQMVYKQQEKIHEELHSKYVALEDQERKAVRRINEEERLHYSSLLQYFKPVMDEQCSMIPSLEKLREIQEELEGCIHKQSDNNAVEDIILRKMNPKTRMEVLTPSSSLSIKRNGKTSLERSPSITSISSSVESEGDGFVRASLRNKGDCEPSLESHLRDRSMSPPSRNEITLSDDDLQQMYAGMTHKRPMQLQRQNSIINRYGSPQRYEAPLSNIEEHHELMPQPMTPLENIYQGESMTPQENIYGVSPGQGAPVKNDIYGVSPGQGAPVTDDIYGVTNTSSEGSPVSDSTTTTTDLSSSIPTTITNSLEEAKRCMDSSSPEQMGKDDDSSEGSQRSSSGYGSPGDEHLANNASTTPNPFQRNNSRRASFSTFSPLSPPITRNTNFPTRRHSFRENGTIRQSSYVAPPSIPENPNLVPTSRYKEMKNGPNNQHRGNLHQNPQKQSSYAPPHMQTGQFYQSPQNQSSHFSESPRLGAFHPNFQRSNSEAPRTGAYPPNFQRSNSHPWTHNSREIDPVTKQVEIFPFNESSNKPKCLENSFEEEEEYENLPPPPDYGYLQEAGQRGKRMSMSSMKPAGGNNWSQEGQEIQMVYDHFYTDNLDAANN